MVSVKQKKNRENAIVCYGVFYKPHRMCTLDTGRWYEESSKRTHELFLQNIPIYIFI